MYIKRLFCILLLSSILIDCQTQAKRVRIFEFGPMLGIMFPLSSDHNLDRSPVASIGLETG